MDELFDILNRIIKILIEFSEYIRYLIVEEYIEIIINDNNYDKMEEIIHLLKRSKINKYWWKENISSLFLPLKLLKEIIDKMNINEKNSKKINEDLGNNYKIIEEGIISRLKILGIENTKIFSDKFETIGNDKKSVINTIKSLNLEQDELKYLLTLTPFNFTGLYKL